MAQGAVVCSAPGKVLVAGGYLVLDRAYSGLVFGLDARIHVIVEEIPATTGVTFSEITVRSPQFEDAVWEYGYRLTEHDGGIGVTPLRVDADHSLNRNPFVETTLRYALTYIVSRLPASTLTPASITILADNDYYTTSTASRKPARFHNFGVPLSKAHKTGLGSSAALVTSLTAALLKHYLPKDAFDLSTSGGKRHLHNLAQASHCAAQGKVGSGFDVASAVFGSCIYRRFSPDILATLPEAGTPGFARKLRQVVDEHETRWDTEVQKDEVKVPAGLRMVMCDVSCGSQTPGMVKKVLAWRAAHPDVAGIIWHDLHSANLRLASEMRGIADTKSQDYSGLRAAFDAIRQLIRIMSRESGVPIEPLAQTRLIDACCDLPGVIGGTVPGAGGYDAIVLLIEDSDDVVTRLQKLFETCKFDGEGGGGGDRRVSMLEVREEMDGARAEDVPSYSQWLDKRRL